MMQAACVSPSIPCIYMQAQLISSAMSGEHQDFYLGIVHVEVNRSYTNYFYKMQVS